MFLTGRKVQFLSRRFLFIEVLLDAVKHILHIKKATDNTHIQIEGEVLKLNITDTKMVLVRSNSLVSPPRLHSVQDRLSLNELIPLCSKASPDHNKINK